MKPEASLIKDKLAVRPKQDINLAKAELFHSAPLPLRDFRLSWRL